MDYIESLNRDELIAEVKHLQELVKAYRGAIVEHGRDGCERVSQEATRSLTGGVKQC